jgi:hypothetical protein
MKKQKFPPGWDEKRVREVIAHYENQPEDEEFAEIEADLSRTERDHDGRSNRPGTRCPRITRSQAKRLN